MALNATDIEKVLAEVAPLLESGWIQKIQQPSDRTLVFDVRVPGKTRRLLVSCEPGTTRLHLSCCPLANQPRPPNFCQFLRAHLQGARIDRIQQQPNDRIVVLHLTTKHGPGTVVCELTGKTANVLVLDENQCVMRDLTRQSQVIGQTYQPPSGRGIGRTDGTPSRFAAALDPGECPISAAIEAYYHDKEASVAQAQARDARLHTLRKLLKKEQRRIGAWREDLARADKYRDYSRYGELIKANLGSIQKGMDRIELVDYYDDAMPSVTIPLDSTKSAQGNMDDYFRKYRKYLAATRELNPRIVQAERGVEKLIEEVTAIEKGFWTPPRPAPSATRTAVHQTSRKSQGIGEHRRGPFRRFVSTDGIPIFVGRNARENDELTFGLAKSDDLWLHARGTPGSHVVVRLEKGTDSPPETLKDAATLALLYSDLKKSGKGEVIYTKRKWVKKAKGQASGAVLVTQEKSLHMKLDKQRLEALKARNKETS
jgi:predicted ribosome quality control (RQC) complex YloA/Tae2 family protein